MDDGLATGVTAKAATRAIRKEEPRRIIFAVPVCASDTARSLSEEVDALVCLEAPPSFGAVGLWFQNFEQTSDEEVLEWLERAREETAEEGGREAPATGSASRWRHPQGPSRSMKSRPQTMVGLSPSGDPATARFGRFSGTGFAAAAGTCFGIDLAARLAFFAFFFERLLKTERPRLGVPRVGS